MPGTPLLKRTISLARTLGRPETRAMPSPTSSTLPISMLSTSGVNPSICASNDLVMSLVNSVMELPSQNHMGRLYADRPALCHRAKQSSFSSPGRLAASDFRPVEPGSQPGVHCCRLFGKLVTKSTL